MRTRTRGARVFDNVMICLIAILLALNIEGCVSDTYRAQEIDVYQHRLILHETHVGMENAYEKWWGRYGAKSKEGRRPRGSYRGFFDPIKNKLHCVIPWPENCIAHEYLHLADKYGLELPKAPQYNHYNDKPRSRR